MALIIIKSNRHLTIKLRLCIAYIVVSSIGLRLEIELGLHHSETDCDFTKGKEQEW